MTTRKPLIAAILAAETMMLVTANSAPLIQANLEYLSDHARSGELFARAQDDDDDDFWPDDDDWLAYFRPYVVKDGILQIPVQGVLLHKFPYSFGRWATGYQYIERALARGLADPEVRGIALVCDTPGGMVAGCFECCDKIYEARGRKPIKAYASDSAYSAGYAIASSADSITVTRSGGVGSIGVVSTHFEYEKMLDRMGIKVTFIYAGKHKVDGNAYEALSDTAKKRMQNRVDKLYGVFTGMVSRNRDMDEGEVRATEALTYDAEEGIEVGLADKIGALDEELALFASEFAETGDEDMAVTQPNVTGKKPGSEENAATLSQADVDAAKAEGVAEGVEKGTNDERARVTAILALDDAAERPVATGMMIELGVSAEVAKEKLAKMPVEKPQATKDEDTKTKADGGDRNHFEEHMEQSGNPGIKTTGKSPDPTGKVSAEDQLKAIFADSDAVTGHVAKKA
jgi:signal peptide peptidase SppA